MWWLVSDLLTSEIAEGDQRPKMHSEGGKWTSCSRGYDTREELIKGERIQDKHCCVCGEMIAAHYVESVATALIEKQLCYSCNFWDEKYQRFIKEKDENKIMIVKGGWYAIGDEDSKSGFRGFGGHKFQFEKDGKIYTSTNVWFGGDISPHFLDKLPDNAKFYTPNEDSTCKERISSNSL